MKHAKRAPAYRRQRSLRRTSRCESLESRHLLAARLVINEVMYHAATGQDGDEWIELHNAGDAAANLLGYRFADGVDYTFPDTTLNAGEFLVVAADVDAFRAQYPDVSHVIGSWTGRLSNRAETIELVDAAGNRLDIAKYADSGDWAARRRETDVFGVPGWTWVAPHDGLGPSAELVNLAMPHDLGHNWAPSAGLGGTPGAANSVAAADIAPAIAEVAHWPVIPTSADDVTITARIVDEVQAGIAATLIYRESTLTPGQFISVPMHDDGQHGDGASGDGVFAASIPPFANETVVEFFLEAADAGGSRRSSPTATDDNGGHDANYLYQVDDTVRPGDLPLFRTIMTVVDRADFARQIRDSDALSNATFIATIGGEPEFRYNAGVRYRGSGTRNNPVPNNRINIPADRPWQNVTQLNINAAGPHNQIAGSTLFAIAELPAADAIPVRMLGNERDLARGGFYAYVEVLNGDWADRHFPNDSQGNVYRGRRANEGPPGGLGAGLAYLGDNEAFYVSYLKGSNSSQADYSDLVRLTDVLNNAPDELYLEQIEEVANVDQWLRTIAMIDLTGYGEFSLLTGDASGDDYAMYRGVEDARFQMIPYDLDEMFTGTPVLRALNVPALNRLLNHPDIRPRYNAQLVDLIDRSLTPERVRTALQEVLGSVRSDSQLNSIVNFITNRGEQMRRGFPEELTASIGLQQVDGFYRTNDSDSGAISGTAPGVTTRRVELNGAAANWNGVASTWSIDNVSLLPGFNRLSVQAFDADGQLTDSITLDVLRSAAGTTVSEPITSDTTWTAAGGPYQIDRELVVAAGATLTIEPGTAVWFGNNARMIIQGRLIAEGTAASPIWFTRAPGSAGNWAGLQFRDSAVDNRMHYAVLQFGQTDDGMIGLENSRLELNHATLANSTRRRIRSIDSSLVVRNSTFATIAAPGEPPATDNLSEHIWGRGVPADGEWILENNRFGHATGHNDLIDFDAPKLPNPIPIIRNNIFEGGGDDALDMTGDVYIEGNIFRNFIKDQFNTDPGQSNTISASGGTFYVVGNVFYNVQHASLVKEQAFMHFANNTVFQSESAPLYFDLPGQTSGPGIGARVEGSVFSEIGELFDQVRPATDLTVNYSFVPAGEVGRGVGNLTGNAQLDVADERYPARPGSPLLGAGPHGADMGAPSTLGAIVTSQPPALTSRDDAMLTVGGAGIVNYRYRVNTGPWSDPQSIQTPIQLSDLADGEYTVEVIGENLIGQWQAEADAGRSRSWKVDATLSGVRINEVLARNVAALDHQGAFPDVIELYNVGRSQMDLSGMSLSDDPLDPRQFTFPAGTTLAAGQYLVLYADSDTSAPGLHLGFALSAQGDGVYLYDAVERGGQLVDSIEFGLQAADISLGVGDQLEWTITHPTLGGPNREMPQSDPSQLRISEWLANPGVSVNNDFLELHNSGFGPIDLGGLYVTDSPLSWRDRHQMPPLSVIAGDGYQALEADGDPEDGADHVAFNLARLGDMIGLYDAQQRPIDIVRFASQQTDVSEGFALSPDGPAQFARFELPTPGLPNPSTSVGSETFIAIDANWRYDQSRQELGTSWRAADFDDSSWPVGAAALYVETSPIPAPTNTPLEVGATTYYFRHEFLVDDSAAVRSLALTTVIDDGAIVYLNGTEVLRRGLPSGEVQYSTLANRTVSNADEEGPFDIPLDALVSGRNVLAVEVHQQSASSSDVVMAMRLDAEVQQSDVPAYRAIALQRDLRITELMYNPLGNDDYEFIEIQNTGIQPINLDGVRLAGGVDFVFPPLELGPDEFAVVVADSNAFRERYGNLALVAGQFERSLSNGGEEIQLILPDPYTTNILSFTYNDIWYPTTDGGGFSLVAADERAPRGAWTEARGWRPSNFVNGSPGFVDSGLDVGILKINEILANTAGPAGDQIEILNTTASALDISGWHLSNDPANLTKYRLPDGMIIQPEELLVLNAVEHFGTQFTLNDYGGEVLLASPDAIGAVAGFIVAQTYGAAEVNSSVGRHERSDGTDDFVIQSELTLGASNRPPLVDDVVISEIAYSPTSGDEFIELHNRGADTISLFATAAPERTWSLGGAIEFQLPGGVQIPPDGYLLIVGDDPDLFRQTHDVPANVPVLGPYTGSLDNVGDDLRLLRPVSEQPEINLLVDRVNYSAELPWPVEAGSGPSSLIRVPLEAYGNDPASWAAGVAFGTPGSSNAPIDTTPPSSPSALGWQVDTGPAIQLSWSTASDPETGVVEYRVYRDQLLVGTSITTDFVDSVVTAPGRFAYHVTAVNAQGLESEPSEVLDVGIMSVESVNSRFNNQVVIRFTEPVVAASAEMTDNYRIDGIDVLAAQLSADGQTLSLTTSPMQLDTLYGLVVQNVVGVAGTPFPPGLEFSYSYREGIPGFTIHGIQARQTNLRSLADLDALLAQPPGVNQIARQLTDIYANINFSDDDEHVSSDAFDGDLRFPTDEAGEENNFLIHAAGFLIVPPEQTGVWTFGANVDAPQTTEGYRKATAFGSTWKYSDTGADLGTQWRDPDFDDAAWPSGIGPFGYGDGVEATRLDFGTDANNKVTTYYFRTTFNLASLDRIVGARGSFQRDDGAAIYLNGVEVARQNLPPDAAYGDLALLENEPPFESAAFQFELDHALLREGENILAVEVHQSSLQGDDIRFDLELEVLAQENASDDGFRLLIDGSPVITADAPNSASERFGTVELSAGAHAIAFDFFEATDGAEVELFAAAGQFRAFGDTDGWRLVGDRAAGGLGVTTDPLPPNPLSWSLITPDGALLGQATALGTLKGSDVPVGYAVELRAGELLSAVVEPESAGATLTVRVRNSLQTLQTWQAAAAGAPVLVSGITAAANGTYVLEISSDVPSDFQLDALANAFGEMEHASTTVTNNTAATAQDLGASRVSELSVSQWAVRGQTDGGEVADYYSVSLQQGDIISVALAWESEESSRLELYGSDLRQVAVGADRGVANVISDYRVPADGTYYVRIARDDVADYQLVVTQGAGLDATPNESIGSATLISPTQTIAGALAVEFAGEPADSSQTTPVPLLLTDGEGYQWNIQPEGYVSQGTSGAYDFAHFLSGASAVTAGELEEDGRELVLGPSQILSDLTLTRKIYVSPDLGFTRYLETFTNNGNLPVTWSAQLYTNLGSDGGTQLVATGSGDTTFNESDHWLVTDDADGRNDPTLLHLFSGPGGQGPQSASLDTDELVMNFQLQLDPGETQIFMHFAAQNADRQTALLKSATLSGLTRGALAGMSIEEISHVVNFQITDVLDSYALYLTAGQQVTWTTQTPSSEDVLRAGTVIDPALTLFDPTGNEVAENDNGAPDGRNAQLTWTAAVDGVYVVQVASREGAGGYWLTSSVYNVPPLRVASSDPEVGLPVGAIPNSWRLDFSSPLALTSIEPGDLLINNQPAETVEVVDGDSLRFLIDPALVADAPTVMVRLGEQVVSDYAGTGNELFEATFVVDPTAPRVVNALWNGEPLPRTRLLPGGSVQVAIQLDEPIRTGNLDLSDITVLVNDTDETVMPFALDYDPATDTILATFFLNEGDYTLRVASGDGGLEDIAGNDLDGDSSAGSLPSGDGTRGGDYRVPFRVDEFMIDLSPRWGELKPAGSFVARATVQDSIAYGNDIDSYGVNLSAGERLSVDVALAAPNSDSDITVEVRDPWGRVVGRSSVDVDGQLPSIESLRSLIGGQYQIRIAGGDVGQAYTLTLLRNSIEEKVDTSARRRIEIDDSLVQGPMRRYAVLGSSQPLDAATLVWGVQPASGQIVVVDPATGDIAMSFAAPGNLAATHTRIGLTMADVGQTLLYVNADDDPTRVYQLDPMSGEVRGTLTIESGSYDGLAFEAGKLFLSQREADVIRQTVAGDPPIGSWSAGSVRGGLGGDDYGRVFGLFADGMIREFDPNVDRDEYILSIPTPVNDLEGLAFDGTLLYTSAASGALLTFAPDEEGTPLVREASVEGGALFALAALSERGGGGSGDGQVTEQEPNNTRATAQNLDGQFVLTFDDNIGDASTNTSSTIPHVTVRGRGTGNFDYYSFTVTEANTRGLFDIDASANVDSYLRLRDPDGNIVSENDDRGQDPGSSAGVDSFIDYMFPEPGEYTIEVGSCCVSDVPAGARYNLHVSVEAAVMARSKDVELIAAGSNWRYWDQATLPSDNWTALQGMDDTNWSQGRGQLGYGEADEQTVVSFGADENNRPITTYFRKTIEIADPSAYAELWVDLLIDDAAAVYLNGQLVITHNLPTPFDGNTAATESVEGDEENVYQPFSIDPGLLRMGQNVIAVEAHQSSPSDSDLSFDLRLRGRVDGVLASLPTAPERDAYTVDLTGSTGHSIDILLAGQQGARFTEGSTLRLLDASGQTVLAEATAAQDGSPSNYDLAIRDFVVPADGTYTVVLESDLDGTYVLLLTDGAAFDTEPNAVDAGSLRRLAEGQDAYGIALAVTPSFAVDPQGDTVSSNASLADIAGLDAVVEGNTLVVSVEFHHPIQPSSPTSNDGVFVYIELDTDQDPTTGSPSLQNQNFVPGQPGGPMGVEFAVNASTGFGGQASLFNPQTGVFVDSLPMSSTDTAIRVEIPLAHLGDDGVVNLGVITGRIEVSDAAPDNTFLTSQLEPGEGSSETDVYEISLPQGQTQRVTVQTLPGIDGQLTSAPYRLSVLEPGGNVLVSDDVATGELRDADLLFTAPGTGVYRLVIEAGEQSIRYRLKQQPVTGAEVLGRYLFYNHSARDGDDPLANDADDAAIAVDKLPLLAGNAVGFENYSNFLHGINGIMIDLHGAQGTPNLDDFAFQVGNNDQPNSWTDAPAPVGFLVRAGAGTAGSDRITIIWADGAIRDQWLEVSVRATPTTGLAAPDVFYFGNLVGETGDSPAEISVTSIDTVGVNHAVGSIAVTTGYFEPFDFNRDNRVDSFDVSAVPSVSSTTLQPVFAADPNVADPVFDSGDGNFDGIFDMQDLMLALQLGEFEDLFGGNSSWSEGDWDGDGDFTTRDLVFAFQRGGFQDP